MIKRLNPREYILIELLLQQLNFWKYGLNYILEHLAEELRIKKEMFCNIVADILIALLTFVLQIASQHSSIWLKYW